jgi:hypothetical protein
MPRTQLTAATAKPPPPEAFALIELPASYHGGSGAFSSVASHYEIKDRPVTKGRLPKPIKVGATTDLVWLPARTTGLP